MIRQPLRQIMRQSHRLLACTPAGREPQIHQHMLTADHIMSMPANKATRFVYLRTLPLVKQVELDGHVDVIASSIETMTKTLCEKHAATVADDRSAVHLHTASLAIATHRVLATRIKNQIRLSNIIRAGFGAVPTIDPSKPDEKQRVESAQKRRPDFWIVRAALWFSFDRMTAIRKMTANMVRDFGSRFETELRDHEEATFQKHELIVSKLCPSLKR